jgi:hypothetical protein
MSVKFTNNAATTLTTAVSIGATSFTVASASTFPTLAVGDWTYVSINDEVVKVTATSGTTFTCDAISEAHSNSSTVELRMTAELLNDFAEDTEALPLTGGAMTGAITTNSTFDGRDVATDGAKLDGIAASANNYTHPANHAISVITGLQTALDDKVDDTQVLTDVPAGAVFTDTTYTVGDGGLTQVNFTTADNTKLDGIEALADVTDTTNVVAALSAGTGVSISGAGEIAVTAVALTTVQTAVSEVAHLALTAQEGDVVVRSDENKSYVHNGGVAGTMADYTLLATPTDAVLSVAGKTGAVTLDTSNVSENAANKYYTEARVSANTSVAANTAKVGITTAQANAIVANTAKVTNVSTNLSTTTTATTNTVVSSDGTNAVLPAATTTVAGVQTGADKLKLDGIEALADVTDTANVTAAGAAMLTGATFTGAVTAPDFIGPLNGAVQFTAKNTSGGTITKGQAIAISGISGNTPTVALADADATTMPAFGLAATTAADTLELEIITFGSLKGVQTNYTGWALGDTLYISTTAGTLTNVAPSGEAAKIQNIGTVERLHSSNGTIKVGGAGRSNATPNLNDGNVFIGNASNQAAARALVVADTTGLQTALDGKETLGDAVAMSIALG